MDIDGDKQQVLAPQAEALERSFRSLIVAIARLARFQVDVHRLGVQGFVSKAPTVHANALRSACSDYDKSVDSIETAIRHAIAVVERDIRVATGQAHPSPPAAAPPISAAPPTAKEEGLPFTTDVVDLSTPKAEERAAPKRLANPEVVEIIDDDDVPTKVDASEAKPASTAANGLPEPPDAMNMDDDIFGGSLFGSNANSEAEPSAPVSPAGPSTAPGGAPAEGAFDPQLDLLNQLVAATSSSAQPPAASSSAIDLSSLLTGIPPSSSAAPPAPASRPPNNGAPSADLLALFESLQGPAPQPAPSAQPSAPSLALNAGALFESAIPSTALGPLPSSGRPGASSALNLAALASSNVDFPQIPTLATSGAPANAGAGASDFNVGDMLMDQSEFESLLNSYTTDTS